MVRYLLCLSLVFGLLPLLDANSAYAARPSQELLPTTTKGYLSIPDLEQLREKWEQTQLGQFLNEPEMKPFVEDLRRQISARMNETNARLGINWEDVERAAGGEVCIAVVQPWDEAVAQGAVTASVEKSAAAAKKAGRSEQQIATLRKKAERSARQEQERQRLLKKALVMLVDVTGHEQEAKTLVNKMSENLLARGGSKGSATLGEVTMVRFTFPIKQGESAPREAYYCLHQDQLIAVDNRDVAQAVLDRVAEQAEHPTSLSHVPAFQVAMAHSHKAMGEVQAQIRWFVEPFGYIEVSRAYNGGRKKRGMDLLKTLAKQGFAAIQGLAGQVALSTGNHEFLHRAFVYAPPVQRKPGEEGQGRFDLAANMLDFPNSPLPKPPSWVPVDVATYGTFTWRMRQAFEYSSTLVDEIAGDEVFEDVLKSIKTDPNGPQIDIRRDLVAHFAERATLIADYREPITPQCERILFAIELTDPVTVRQTIHKAMESDPAAKKRTHNDHVIWEILNEESVEVETLRIDDPAFGFGFDDPEPVEEEDPLIPNSAITVAHGQLLVSSHVDYIVDILDQPADAIGLDGGGDFRLVKQALDALGAGDDSFHFFTRTEQAYRPTYELIRQGKMPESETMVGQILNQLWGSDEKDSLRKQFIDNTNMPSFDLARKYLGPAGTFIHTEDEGWAIAGCLLKKD